MLRPARCGHRRCPISGKPKRNRSVSSLTPKQPLGGLLRVLSCTQLSTKIGTFKGAASSDDSIGRALLVCDNLHHALRSFGKPDDYHGRHHQYRSQSIEIICRQH